MRLLETHVFIRAAGFQRFNGGGLFGCEIVNVW